ncbi:ribonuclease P protein component [Nocardiopsis xinjiangensis]|uniref:ribonuclease P protein component n=1 Tax=Nocardiopsis xinjiangensis TaxID=124285 RepID=UPI000345984D|nr:ribonuclease P protein component [Nocardiopsis xinjiangensis]
MLSPRNRMRHSSEFGSVMRSGRRSSRDTLGVVYLPPPAVGPRSGEDPDPPRIGFIVSKAVGGAVVRKRVQRRLRHLMRSRLSDLPDGSLLVVRAKPSSSTARNEELAAQLDSAIAAAKRPKSASRRRRGRDRTRPPADPANGGTEGNRRPEADGERWTSR